MRCWARAQGAACDSCECAATKTAGAVYHGAPGAGGLDAGPKREPCAHSPRSRSRCWPRSRRGSPTPSAGPGRCTTRATTSRSSAPGTGSKATRTGRARALGDDAALEAQLAVAARERAARARVSSARRKRRAARRARCSSRAARSRRSAAVVPCRRSRASTTSVFEVQSRGDRAAAGRSLAASAIYVTGPRQERLLWQADSRAAPSTDALATWTTRSRSSLDGFPPRVQSSPERRSLFDARAARLLARSRSTGSGCPRRGDTSIVRFEAEVRGVLVGAERVGAGHARRRRSPRAVADDPVGACAGEDRAPERSEAARVHLEIDAGTDPVELPRVACRSGDAADETRRKAEGRSVLQLLLVPRAARTPRRRRCPSRSTS